MSTPSHDDAGRLSPAAVQVVDRFFTLVATGELAEAVALFADDAELRIPEGLPHGGTYTGPQGVRDSIARLYGRAAVDFVRGPILPLGEDRAVAYNRLAGVKPLGSSGDGVEMQLAETYTVADGRITRADIWYWDTTVVRDVLQPA